MTRIRYYAKPELRERLMLVRGSRKDYAKWTHARFTSPPDQRTSIGMLKHILAQRKYAPIAAMVDLVRVAEDRDLSRDEAWELRHKWFVEGEIPEKEVGDDA